MNGATATLANMPLSDVVGACRAETGKFLRRASSDDAFCFELFRRAVCDRSQAAWEAVVAQYRGIVLAWVRQHSAAAAVHEDDSYWVNRTFERLWTAVGPDRFGMFSGLPALLKYFKMCVHSVLLDELRARHGGQLESLDDERDDGSDHIRVADVEDHAVGQLSGIELWRAIGLELADEAERRVVYLSFALDMKPGEIFERHPNQFGGVHDVYRIKRNVIERLRRNPEIRRFLA